MSSIVGAGAGMVLSDDCTAERLMSANKRDHPAKKMMVLKMAKLYRNFQSQCRGCCRPRYGSWATAALGTNEDIRRHIHTLLPLRDAARAACASHSFLRLWRCHSNLILSQEALGLDGDLISKVDHILKNHSGVGMKKLSLELCGNKVDSFYVDRWIHIAVTAGVEELVIIMPHIPGEEEYNFPCSLLFNGGENSIRYLYIAMRAFRPTAGLGCCRRLTRLILSKLWIADDELEGLLSNCTALQQLELRNCHEIVCLKIPLLKWLTFLRVSLCRNLQFIDSNAPNLSTFFLFGGSVPILFGSGVKNIEMSCLKFGLPNIVWFAWTELLSGAPDVERLVITSPNEMVSTPMLHSKFLHLKYLHISLIGKEAISPAYDYLSLVSFLEASPCLETFIFELQQPNMKHDSVIGNSSHLRRLPQHNHKSLKSVTIVGFCSAKSLVEFACHIVESATSLERLTLDTSYGCRSPGVRSVDKPDRWYYTVSGSLMAAPPDRCLPMWGRRIEESLRARFAIRRHIERKVPSGVVFKVVVPCSRCVMLNF